MRPIPAIWTLAVAGTTLALAIAIPRALGAAGAAREEARRLMTIRELASQIRTARARSPLQAAERARPRTSLAVAVSGCVEASGLPAESLSGLTTDAGGGGVPGVRHVMGSLTLSGITLRQLGGFLSAWREREPAWTVAGIDVAPESRAAPPAGEDLPLRILLRLEAMYVDQPGGTAR